MLDLRMSMISDQIVAIAAKSRQAENEPYQVVTEVEEVVPSEKSESLVYSIVNPVPKPLPSKLLLELQKLNGFRDEEIQLLESLRQNVPQMPVTKRNVVEPVHKT